MKKRITQHNTVPTQPTNLEDIEISRYASFDRRLIATTIDLVILMLLSIPLTSLLRWLLFAGTNPFDEISQLAAGSILTITELVQILHQNGILYKHIIYHGSSIVLLYLYMIVSWKLWAASPGKYIVGAKIIREDGAPPSLWQYHLRLFGYIPSALFLFLGFFWIYFNKQRKAWHDYIANTFVVRSKF
jgi:uncharacterized RDD family membrane protein YckC